MKFATVHHRQESRDRDRELVAFLRAAFAQQQTGTGSERPLLEAMVRVLDEFSEKYTRPDQPDYFAGQVDALGWVLRCVAEAGFQDVDGFSRMFLP